MNLIAIPVRIKISNLRTVNCLVDNSLKIIQDVEVDQVYDTQHFHCLRLIDGNTVCEIDCKRLAECLNEKSLKKPNSRCNNVSMAGLT